MSYSDSVRRPASTREQRDSWRLDHIIARTKRIRKYHWWWMRWVCVGVSLDIHDIQRIAEAMLKERSLND